MMLVFITQIYEIHRLDKSNISRVVNYHTQVVLQFPRKLKTFVMQCLDNFYHMATLCPFQRASSLFFNIVTFSRKEKYSFAL